MKSDIRAQTTQNQHNNSPIVSVHDLFGSLDNLGVLAHGSVNNHNIIQVDAHNHGPSSGEPVVNCPAMVQDLADTPDALQINKATFISHSMGGKMVMAPAALAPDHIDKLVTIDIASVDYHVRRHDEIFAIINVVSESDTRTRQQAAAIVCQHPSEEGMIQFLLKSFVDGEWRLNVPVLWDQYPHIVGWEKVPARDHPALFIPSGSSLYVSGQYRNNLLAQFPQARAYVIAGAGHWVHTEKPDAVSCAIRCYFND